MKKKMESSSSGKPLRVVSLFSGAGGLDLGFSMAGCQIVWANDLYQDAVKTYVELTVPAAECHLKVAREAAEGLTTDKSAVTVAVSPDEPKMVVTTFPMVRARQIDVVDRIMHAFAMDMEDYSTQSIGFPKSEAEQRRDKRKLERAKERRRERRAAREAGACGK